MAVVNIPNVPQSISLLDFKALSDQFGGLAKSCRFAVRIAPQGSLIQQISGGFQNDLMYLCEAAEYPGRGFLNVDLRYYGPNFKLPYQSQYEDITLTFLCRNDSIERLFFDNWQTIINPPDTFNFSYRNDYRAQIDIFHMDDAGDAQYHFSLLDAFPVLVNPQALTWADDQFLRLGVTFTYTSWTRPGIDPPAKNQTSATVFLNQVSS
jgi:hypothetical protein